MVVATTRGAAGAQHLQQLRQQYGERLHISELDTSRPESVQRWAEGLAASVSHVDVRLLLRSLRPRHALCRRRCCATRAAPLASSPP